MVTSAERGIVAGARWAHGLASDHDVSGLLSTLDRLIETETWDYRTVHSNIISTLGAGGQKPSADASDERSTAAHWWLERADSHWPDDEKERTSFVRGFVIGCALEIRDALIR
jgi:hypothetical protein